MLEEPKIKKVDKRDKQLPQNFEQLIEMYDVEKIWPYMKKVIDYINNDLEKIKVSPTEPTTNEKVWIQKGKNLYDKSKAQVNIGLDTSNGSTKTWNDRTTSDFIVVKPNTDYVFSKSFNVFEYAEDKSFILYQNTTKIKTSSNTRYIRFYGDTASMQEVQLEQGSTATEYEAYVERKINARNDNESYEELINLDTFNNMTAKDWFFDYRRVGDFDINTDGAVITYDYSDLGKNLNTSAVIIPILNWFRATAVGTLYDNHKANIYITNRQKFGSSSNVGVYALLIYKK